MALDGVAAAAALAEVPPAGLADGAAAVDPGEAAMRLLGGLQDPAAERVQALSQQQRDLEHERRRLLHERKEVQKRLKNEAKQRKRMVEKTRGLTNSELLTILASRAQAKPRAKGAAKAKAKAKAKAHA